MDWEDVIPVIAGWKDKVAQVAKNVRSYTANLFTDGDIGFYFNPDTNHVAMMNRGGTRPDLVRCKYALDRAVGEHHIHDELLNDESILNDNWIKIAYSPTLRAIGENLNFFPGHHLGVIPNNPNPLAAMLTSALVGGGSGWLMGKLMKKLLPKGYGGKLPRTGATLGALIGGGVASPWAISNLQQGKSLLDGSLLADPPGTKPIVNPSTVEKEGIDLFSIEGLEPNYLKAIGINKEAFQSGELFSLIPNKKPPMTNLDVNLDALGRTLYDSGAGPQLAATAIGTMYAAKQFPDPNARPGWVTGSQLGQLAVNAAGDYATGLLVGGILNATVGTPFRAPVIGAGNAALGIIGAVLPKLFG